MLSRSQRSAGGPDRYDLIVVGGGTGGLVSALVAAGIGARVALIERDRLGGDCLWTGCVPSKSLLAAADLAHRIRHADRVGLSPAEPVVDFQRVMDHVARAQRTIAPQDSRARLERDGVTVVSGSARFAAPGSVDVEGRTLRFRKAIVATGSRPEIPAAVPGLREVDPLTSDSVWELTDQPRRLTIIGGGAVGCELAQAFGRLGSRVTLLEAGDRLLAGEEPSASRLVASRLAAEGVAVRCAAHVASVTGDRSAGALSLGAGAPASLAFDRLLVATGRVPAGDGLGLERIGVAINDRGAIEVDGRLRSTAPHVYAVGDVTGAMAFTHVAAYHARVATINALFGSRRQVDYAAMPRVTFTDPEIAAVGLTEAQARARWRRPQIASFEDRELDRAITDGRPYGFATLVGDPRGRLVGATIAAPGGGESIAELAAWITSGATLDRVSQTAHAYPTLSEGPARAADDHLRARYARPPARRLAGLGLRLLGHIDHP